MGATCVLVGREVLVKTIRVLVGRGVLVRTMRVLVGLGVLVASCVLVGRRVGVRVAVGRSVAVRVIVALALGSPVRSVPVLHTKGVRLAVGEGVQVTVGVRVPSRVRAGVGVGPVAVGNGPSRAFEVNAIAVRVRLARVNSSSPEVEG